MTAGIDLSLAIIEEDLGTQVAQATAQEMVVYLRRSGDQSQYSLPLTIQNIDQRFAKLQKWLVSQLHREIKVPEMAEQVAMSERHFRRVFKQKTSLSPAQYIDQLRMDQARNLLLSSNIHVEQLAAQIGFSQAEVFRRAFKRRFGVTPTDYRQRFR